MRATPFDFHAPSQFDEILGLLEEHGMDAKLIAGGMSLVPMLTLGLVRPAVMISLNHVSDLDYVEMDGDALRLGAMVRHNQILTDPLIREHCPLLSAAAAQVGDVQVRHRGTLGGSVAHADPAADYLPVLYALDASVKVASANHQREVKARDFVVESLRSALEPNEAVIEITVPRLGGDTGWSYERLSRIEGNFAIVNAASVVNASRATTAVGAVRAAPVVLETPSGAKREMLSSVEEAAREACVDAYADLAGDREYRGAMAAVYARRALEGALARAEPSGNGQ